MGKFKNIHIILKKISANLFEQQNIDQIKFILKNIINTSKKLHCNVTFDPDCKQLLATKLSFAINHISTKNLTSIIDLIIIIGGDGSMLKSIRKYINYDIPILGINQGRLGFLADLNIDAFKINLESILQGKYIAEERSLLQASIQRTNLTKSNNIKSIDTKSKKIINKHNHNNNNNKFKRIKYHAVNEIVLYNGKIPKLIEFQIYINDKFVLQQRADGLVIATPTGSTAYSLSAGGPILDPKLKVITLVPLYPHTLRSRPIVVDENSLITLKIIKQNPTLEYGLNFDGQKNILLTPADQITISKHPKEFKLIHPINYNYFTILRDKLGWNQ